MSPKGVFEVFGDRIASAWRDATTSAVAAGLAWLLAAWLFGHSHPVFAAVSAIVCLSPGLPSHGRQAVGLMLGVATGIVVGEAALLLPQGFLVPEGLSLLRLVLATVSSMLIAASFGMAPVVSIQAGVSAVLVLALGPENAGLARLEDVAIGVSVGLLFSQVLLTPDPVRVIDTAADNLLVRLARAFDIAADAAAAQDVRKAQAALRSFTAAHESLVALGAGIDASRYAARWSLRGRLAARNVAEMAARYDRRAIRLFAASLLFGEALADALRKGAAPVPEGLADKIRSVADRCRRIPRHDVAAGEGAGAATLADASAAVDWRPTVLHLQATCAVLTRLESLEREAGVVASSPTPPAPSLAPPSSGEPAPPAPRQ
ncbi:MAG TPA: FUSC family protein [Steroidobacteraceae bacterium]|nr:FUSC family protein [Steroidobacteraceae bacterium]